MTITEPIAREYRHQRREGNGARVALSIARARWAPTRYDWHGDTADAGEVDGFRLTLTVEPVYDEPTDVSWLGEWTDDDGPDTVANPEARHGSYSHFRPTYTFEDRCADLARSGACRADVRRLARARMAEDAQLAHDLADYVVTVEAERDGVTGHASLGSDWTWRDDDERMAEELAADLIPEAIADAWRNVARRMGAYGPQLLATVAA